MTDGAAIEAEGLTKTFGRFTAIADVDLRVEHGEFMGLLGPNGSGKSTTLKVITGLLRPTSGTVRIDGTDIRDHRRALEHVGCVIETPEPYPELTPNETLSYVGRIYGLDREEARIRIRDVLEITRMWEWRNKPVGGFSKGMRQRIVLAQALMSNPETIILDEPTSGLDPRGMIEVRKTLIDLRSRDRSLLISTHILSEVSELCDHVTMIRNGRVVVSGEVSNLLRRIASTTGVTVEMRTMNPVTGDTVALLEGCDGVRGSTRVGEHVLRLDFAGTPEQQARLVETAVSSGAGVLAMNEIGANLESLYMGLTSGDEIL